MVELEALACGRPVVSWFTYGDAYPEAPPFVNAFTGPEIAAAVRNLLAEPGEASRIGKAGRAWVVANHNADSIAERIEARAIADPR
jgi:glycosyltransferase involved in cell wall biosynthesis